MTMTMAGGVGGGPGTWNIHRIVTVVMGPLENEHVEPQPGLVQMIFLFSIGRFLDEPAVNFQGNNYKKA